MCEDSVSMQPRRQEIIEGLKQLPGNELIMFRLGVKCMISI